jgi:serine/threonine-protein phosphatase PP1 catalytic subunit
MGNQPSKDGKSTSGSQTPTGPGPSLDSYPSFSKSDTKESMRSFRNSLRTKIPGSRTADSPRGSTSGLGDVSADERADVQSVKSTTSGRSKRNSALSLDPDSRKESVDVDDSPMPPPSPTTSPSVNVKNPHSDVAEAQRSGEVDVVSDAPPGSGMHHTHGREPGPSILKETDKPASAPAQGATAALSLMDQLDQPAAASSNNPEIGALKEADLDDMIKRLVDAGYAGKVTKTVCLKNAEITAVCNAAREVFLSQPALLELSPPVKIVGDVHGQYTDLIRMFEMCGRTATSYSLAIMSTAASRVLRLFCCFSATRSATPRTSSSFVETMNVPTSPAFTAFTTNARDAAM